MKRIALAMAVLAAGSLFAVVKPISEPWLKSGETLACFGDSITAGKNYYIKYLTEALEKKGIKVINCGVSGDKTPMAMTRIKEVADLKPDAVMFFFGANDSVIGRGRWRDEPVIEPTTFRDNLVWMIHYFRMCTKINKFSIVAPTGRCEGAAYGEFGKICDQFGLAARDAADRANAILVPLDTEFDFAKQANLKDPKGHYLTADGVHFSKIGSELAAQVMLKCWNLDK